jgi:hypothetical protein
MRLWSALCAVLLIFSTVIAQKKIEVQKGDTPLVREVKGLLALPPGFSSSFSEKQANRLGDKVSVALLKIYSKEEMENPENIKVFLPVIRSAFLYPNLIPAGDREPRVTLPLLARLEKNVGNPELKRDIGTLISSIKEQTSKSKRNRP